MITVNIRKPFCFQKLDQLLQHSIPRKLAACSSGWNARHSYQQVDQNISKPRWKWMKMNENNIKRRPQSLVPSREYQQDHHGDWLCSPKQTKAWQNGVAQIKLNGDSQCSALRNDVRAQYFHVFKFSRKSLLSSPIPRITHFLAQFQGLLKGGWYSTSWNAPILASWTLTSSWLPWNLACKPGVLAASNGFLSRTMCERTFETSKSSNLVMRPRRQINNIRHHVLHPVRTNSIDFKEVLPSNHVQA